MDDSEDFQQFIAPQLSALNTIAVDRFMRCDATADSKNDVRSLFDEEIQRMRTEAVLQSGTYACRYTLGEYGRQGRP